VHRTLKQIYAQVIDDVSGTTLCSSSSLALAKAGSLADGAKGGNVAGAGTVGSDLAHKVKALGLSKVRFDRGGNRYHGRIKALADAARAGGLEF
jgi:large subunit ribosomal protein L18